MDVEMQQVEQWRPRSNSALRPHRRSMGTMDQHQLLQMYATQTFEQSVVSYRSTLEIFVNGDAPVVEGTTDRTRPKLERCSSLDNNFTLTKVANSDGGTGKRSRKTPRRSFRTRMTQYLRKKEDQFLYEKNMLPEHPSCAERIHHAFLCPPHGRVADITVKILLGLLVWLTALSVFKDDALPGGNIFALLILVYSAFVGGYVVSLIRLPPLLGMLIAGFMLRNVPGINIAGDIDPRWSSVLRNVALTVILTRAGLGLDGKALRKLSKSVLLLSFLPCTAEAITVGIAAFLILSFPWLWAFLLGFLSGAVSPAVLVPFMLHLQDTGMGTRKGIPTLLIAASSLDDVLAISGFTILLSVIFSTGSPLWFQIVQGPVEILMGVSFGLVVGVLFWYFPDRQNEDLSVLRFVFLFLGGLVAVFGSKAVGFSGAGALGCLITAFVAAHKWRQPRYNADRVKASVVFAYMWTFCQPLLFGLIGAEVDLQRVNGETVGLAIAVLIIGIVARMAFSVLAVSGAGLNCKEKLFTAIAWLPKATVQAALGSLALDTARELKAAPEVISLGEKVVTIAVLLIVITAPLGAIGIGLSAPLLLEREPPTSKNDVESNTGTRAKPNDARHVVVDAQERAVMLEDSNL